MKKPSLWNLLRKVHENEEGAVSLETILIIGAIALPILIFLIKVGWPRIKDYFNQGLGRISRPAPTKASRVEWPAGSHVSCWPRSCCSAFVPVATVTDLARHKIYNWTTYTGMLAALGLNAAGSAVGWPRDREPRSGLQSLGWIPFLESLLGLAGVRLRDAGLLRDVQGRRRRRETDGHARGASWDRSKESKPCCGRSCSAGAWA